MVRVTLYSRTHVHAQSRERGGESFPVRFDSVDSVRARRAWRTVGSGAKEWGWEKGRDADADAEADADIFAHRKTKEKEQSTT